MEGELLPLFWPLGVCVPWNGFKSCLNMMVTTQGFCRHRLALPRVVAGSCPCALLVGTVPSPTGHPHYGTALGTAKGTCGFCWHAQGQARVPEK